MFQTSCLASALIMEQHMLQHATLTSANNHKSPHNDAVEVTESLISFIHSGGAGHGGERTAVLRFAVRPPAAGWAVQGTAHQKHSSRIAVDFSRLDACLRHQHGAEGGSVIQKLAGGKACVASGLAPRHFGVIWA